MVFIKCVSRARTFLERPSGVVSDSNRCNQWGASGTESMGTELHAIAALIRLLARDQQLARAAGAKAVPLWQRLLVAGSYQARRAPFGRKRH